MGNNGSALETLAAFAICFVAGVVSTLGMGVYSKWVTGDKTGHKNKPAQAQEILKQ